MLASLLVLIDNVVLVCARNGRDTPDCVVVIVTYVHLQYAQIQVHMCAHTHTPCTKTHTHWNVCTHAHGHINVCT